MPDHIANAITSDEQEGFDIHLERVEYYEDELSFTLYITTNKYIYKNK